MINQFVRVSYFLTGIFVVHAFASSHLISPDQQQTLVFVFKYFVHFLFSENRFWLAWRQHTCPTFLHDRASPITRHPQENKFNWDSLSNAILYSHSFFVFVYTRIIFITTASCHVKQANNLLTYYINTFIINLNKILCISSLTCQPFLDADDCLLH